jgi:hypothetical protein
VRALDELPGQIARAEHARQQPNSKPNGAARLGKAGVRRGAFRLAQESAARSAIMIVLDAALPRSDTLLRVS